MTAIPQPAVFMCLLLALLAGSAVLFRRRSVVMRVPARYASIRLLFTLLSKIAHSARLGESDTFACRLALDEACVNIIEHAYTTQDRGDIEVIMQAYPGVCTIRLTDFGQPYDPSQIPAPEFGVSLETAQPGGLGLHLMRTLMDDVQYVTEPYGNSLIMVKRRSL